MAFSMHAPPSVAGYGVVEIWSSMVFDAHLQRRARMRFKKQLEASAPFAIKIMWITLIVGPAAWLFASVIKMMGPDSTVSAYWAQAIGSVGAVLGAFLIANSQSRRQLSQALQKDKQKINAMHAVVEVAVKHAASIGEFVEKLPPDDVFRAFWQEGLGGSFEASVQALKSLPTHELGNPELVVHLMAITGSMATINNAASEYMTARDLSIRW